MSDPDASSGVRFTVFDYLGLAFLLGPPSVAAEVLMRGENITSAGIRLGGCPNRYRGSLCYNRKEMAKD
jgi:hypothetical protein